MVAKPVPASGPVDGTVTSAPLEITDVPLPGVTATNDHEPASNNANKIRRTFTIISADSMPPNRPAIALDSPNRVAPNPQFGHRGAQAPENPWDS
jgi:hypothetical protein